MADAFGAMISAALRDGATVKHLPSSFADRFSAPRRSWLKIAASIAAMAAFVGLAAVVGRVVLNESSVGRDDSIAPQEQISQKGESNMIMARKVAALAGAAVLTVSAPAAKLSSEPTFVFLRPETSSFWNTATNSTMTLPIDYPTGATRATLTVNGVGYSRSYANITGDSFDLELPPPTSPETENVFDLTLTFDNGTERTAKLGLIQGLSPDAEGTTRCLAPAEGSVWNSMRSRAVLPIPYGTTSFTVTVNGQETVNDTGLNGAQGWYALGGIKRKDAVSLSLMANGVNYMATLLGRGNGYFVVNFK